MIYTIHKPTIRALKKIKRLKNELFEVMSNYYMSLEDYDRRYIDLFMDDNDINDSVK